MFSKGKKNQKIVVKIVLLLLISFILTPSTAQAVMPGCNVPPETDIYKPIQINFPLPNITEGPYVKGSGDNIHTVYHVKNLSCFVVGIYVYFASVVGILATVMIMYGGIKYLVSMGSPQRMADAKDTIFSAVVGLVLVLGAYMLLNLINPNLIELKVIDPTSIQPVYDLPPCEDVDSTPEEGSEAKECGDFGIITGADEAGNRCYYSGHCAAGEACLHGTENDPWADTFTCRRSSRACESVDDDNAPSEDQSVCDPFSIPNEGVCLWMDYAWYNPLHADDACAWFPQVNCYNDTWDRVSCSQCNGKYDPDDKDCINEDQGPVFQSDPRVDKDRGICCRKTERPSPDYDIGDTYFSTRRWDPDQTTAPPY